MHLTITLTIFCSLLTLVEHKIYLSHSQDGTHIEYYDCIAVGSLNYCRRPDHPINLTRILQPSSCEINGAINHTFADLLVHNVNISTVLHQWKSSIEKAEQYARYLSNPSHRIDGFIYECHRPQSFGKCCEYELPAGDTFQETLDWQVWMRMATPEQVQIHGNITCYRGIECDSGLLCLDWREICDGVQNCMFGLDEEQCDLLELNVCGDDEYRCANGMCIPAEYFLDGELDCLDWSDEMNIKDSADCAREGVSSECDDHMCLSKEWPCGDGQCILDRFAFQKRFAQRICANRRDQYFWCETLKARQAWTMPHGRCSWDRAYTATRKIHVTEAERCEDLLKCALCWGGESGCQCASRSSQCYEFLKNCSSPVIQYPQGAFPTPYIHLFFDRTQQSDVPELILVHGSLKCQGAFINVTTNIPYTDLSSLAHLTETLFCQQHITSMQLTNASSPHHCIYPNQSTDICNEWNPCISITRIRDGTDDCLIRRDENVNQTTNDNNRTCSQVRQHRFRCSDDQPTCLLVIALGDEQQHCRNRHDELWQGTSRPLSQIKCNAKSKDECSLLRQYIDQSWSSTEQRDTSLSLRIPFRSYCDTIVDLVLAEDENLARCRQSWVCNMNQWQCQNHQCIKPEWENDREWDCADGSDEAWVFFRLTDSIYSQYYFGISLNRSLIEWKSCAWNVASFVCLSPHVRHAQFRCVNLSRLGDGTIDCLGGIDERNTLRHPADPSALLGHNFLCPSTNTTIPYYTHCWSGARCPNQSDDQQWCRSWREASECNNHRDFICFDGRCIKEARCIGGFQCPFGEDEYMCDYASISSDTIVSYRRRKEDQRKRTPLHLDLLFPNDQNITSLISDELMAPRPIRLTPINASSLTLLTPYPCNRGVGILSINHSIVCFCPPHYYGNFCQYHADRLSILFHLNLSQSIYKSQSDVGIVIKLLVLFLFHDQVLDTHEFHVRPATESVTFTKKMGHFLYSRSSHFRQHRRQRYHNRSHLLKTQPYSIRVEAYETSAQLSSPVLTGVWHYPIALDHLPVFRFAEVLHLTRSRSHPDSCSSHPCPPSALCQPLINDHTRHICLCKSNYTGTDCSMEDQQCAQGYCAAHSLCRPNYRRLLRGNAGPYCICPFDRLGDRCGIVHDYCQQQPCLNNGSCLPASSPDRAVCICTKYYFGPQCQYRRPHIRLSLIDRLQYEAVVMQHFRVDFTSFDLTLVHQQIHHRLPPSIDFLYDQLTVPEIILAKVYRSQHSSSIDIYLLAISVDAGHVDGSTGISEFNRCDHVGGISNASSPIEYHQVCQEKTQLLCFCDDVYVCVCTDNHSRVECFRYDYGLDRCSLCANGGRCIRENRREKNEFLCICPPCHSGRRCQFTFKSFALTLDQLLYPDLLSNTKGRTIVVLLVFSVLSFLVGMANNLFSFVTLKQKQCLRNGVGHYLLTLSLINQLTLAFLCARLVHIIITLSSSSPYSLINDACCKIFSYGLTCLLRISFWIASLVALERVYTTLFLTKQWLKQPHIARSLIAGIIGLVFLSAAYELVFIKSFSSNDDGTGTTCVSIYPLNYEKLWVGIHQTVSIFNMLVPMLMNICCTSTIIGTVIRTKMNLHQQSTNRNVLRDVLNENKEMIVRPAITLIPSSFSLFSLPVFILAFSLGCRNIDAHSVRYVVLTFYFLTFVPSMLTFILHIYPSSFYRKEWRNTAIGQRIFSYTNGNRIVKRH